MSFLDDHPIATEADDELGRGPFAFQVADQLASLPGAASCVVGIVGRWGEGKTSVLNMIEQRLAREHKSAVVVRFNPWYYQGQSQLLVAFFETLAGAIGTQLRRGKKIAKALRRAGKALGGVSVGVGVVNASVGTPLETLADALDSAELLDLKSKVEELLRSEAKRVVVLVDDIDRLDDDEVAMLFKLVKLAADFDHTAYVLAMDEVAVAAALDKRYANRSGSGANFVEKIVQVPLRLPRVDPSWLLELGLRQLQQILDEQNVALADADISRFSVAFQRHIAPFFDTPRSVKRFLNRVRFSTRSLLGEVNVVDLVLLDAMAAVFPDLYETIRNNKQAALAVGVGGGSYRSQAAEEHVKQRFDPALDALASGRQDAVELLGELFPKTQGVYSNVNFGSDFYRSWVTEKRVCTEEYFDRYFAFGIPAGDVSDAEVDRYVESLASLSSSEAQDGLKFLIAIGSPERVVGKLRHREEQLGPEGSVRLLLAICSVGGQLPDPPGIFALASNPFTQAAILGSQLLRRLPANERESAAKSAIEEADDLAFASELLRWIRADEEDPIVTEVELDHLTATLIERIRREASDGWIVEICRSHAPSVLYAWKRWGSSDEVATHLERFLEHQDNAASLLIEPFAAHSSSMESGARLPRSLTREGYDSIADLVDPQLLADALAARFGAPSETVDPDLIDDDREDRRLAMQFLAIHRLVRGKDNSEPDQDPNNGSE